VRGRVATRAWGRPAVLAAVALAGVAGAGAALGAQAAPAAPGPILVRPAAGVVRRLPVLLAATARGPERFVRAADLAWALGGTATVTGDRVRVAVPGAVVEITDGVPFARVDGREVPLALPPAVADGGALLPLVVVADVLPEAVATLAFDAPVAPRADAGGVLAVVATRPATTVLPTIAGRPSAPGGSAPTAAAGTGERTRAADAGASRAVGRLPASLGRRTVVVDAGHGGPDAGMRGPIVGGVTLTEKEVTLGVSQALRDALAARGVDVVMTRSRDTLIALADRGRIANASRGDLFVSVHVNAANPAWRDGSAARGFETYFLSDARTEDARQVAERENESVRYEAAANTDGDPLRFIVSDLAQNAHVREASRLAGAVQRRLGLVHPGPDRGVHQAGFKVLVTASMPAVLVETGFGSNPAEAAYLVSERGQRELAEAIADAVVEHLARYAGPRGAGAAAGRP